MDTLLQDVLALIRHLGEERVHLVAHDWGGAIAWQLAIEHPEALASLAVCNLPHPALFAKGIRRPKQLLKSWYIFAFQLPWLPERVLAASNYQRLARALISDCRPGTFTRTDMKAILASWRLQGLGGGLNWYRAAMRHPKRLPDPIPLIKTPTILIWGENDRALGKELTYGSDKYVADLSIHYLPDTSHWVQQEATIEVNALLLHHLGRVRDLA